MDRQVAEQKLAMLADDEEISVAELITKIYGERTHAICSSSRCNQMGWIPTGSELEIHSCVRCGEALITAELLTEIVALTTRCHATTK